MKSKYLEALQYLENGEIAQVTAILEYLRKEYEESFENEIEGLRRLISARLQMKTDVAKSFDVTCLDSSAFKDPFLKAETNFVKGLLFYHQNAEKEGSECFTLAKNLYPQPEYAEKSLLAEYNAFVGQINLGNLSDSELELKLLNLEKRSLELGSKKIQAFVLRQKSYHLEDQNKFKGALLSIRAARDLFKETGPASDLYLANLSEIDLLVELGERGQAEMMFEALIGPLDERVAFAKAYIRARLTGSPLNMSTFLSVPPRWKRKAIKQFGPAQATELEISWDEDGMLSWNDSAIFISRTTVEGKLLRLLIDKKSNRAEICERLWPEEAESQLVWNRFHQIVSRLNKKLNDLIVNDNGFYSLKKLIRIKS